MGTLSVLCVANAVSILSHRACVCPHICPDLLHLMPDLVAGISDDENDEVEEPRPRLDGAQMVQNTSTARLQTREDAGTEGNSTSPAHR
jgi:hypothetical protein